MDLIALGTIALDNVKTASGATTKTFWSALAAVNREHGKTLKILAGTKG